MKKFYITTAIDYANSRPHAGHAYEKVATDIMARYKRLRGYDVAFCTGTDEHSLNVQAKAKELNKDPKQYCDEMAVAYRDLCALYEITNTDFIQTTEERHKKSVTELFKRIYDAGDIYKGKYEGWYCKSCEAFYNKTDLTEDNCCPTHKVKADLITEENYFIKISKYTDRLLKHIEDNPGFIEPDTRKNEILAMLKSGFRDISVSRPGINWGIPLPIDPSQTVYVWFDALINYITSAGFATDDAKFNKYWPADVHIIGKDITKFHCIIWPIMLMSAGLELPKKVFGHGFLLNKGEKMSKSRGNVVDPVEMAQKYGAEAIRYYFAADVVNGEDGDFNEDAVKLSFNTNLANDLGNLINRSLNMVEKYSEGLSGKYDESEADDNMKNLAAQEKALWKKYESAMEAMNFSEALKETWKIIGMSNKLIDLSTPWNLFKNGQKAALENVLYLLLEAIRLTSLAIAPVMPATAEKIWVKLGTAYDMKSLDLEKEMQFGLLKEGTKVSKGDPLFPRIQSEEEKEKNQKSKAKG
ncbi:MAG TPA: methionine--tRNA ligase [Candidatus Goldiibacteriota bacterium]|nr:methionine--tRNA ligase [Candidatus Goldiibacteriota bacterium]HPN64596.1 methionine--tRNA ligase [Candidatus Goldiibacteriota bacterium]HRQ43500.1 methionine--tRNA ligase [Candidatus Goldiibacteriota bacterium]